MHHELEMLGPERSKYCSLTQDSVFERVVAGLFTEVCWLLFQGLVRALPGT